MFPVHSLCVYTTLVDISDDSEAEEPVLNC